MPPRAEAERFHPVLQLTDSACARIRDALQRSLPPRRHLRIEVRLENGAYDYRMRTIEDHELGAEDMMIEEPGFLLVLDPESAKRLAGTTIDFRDSLLESGFTFDNPNAPASPFFPTGAREDLTGPLPERIQRLLDTEINPAIAAHGGRVTLVDVREGKAYVAFGGGCHGCGMVDVTLKQGVETRIREVVPEIAEVVDTTDHATGQDPYYRF